MPIVLLRCVASLQCVKKSKLMHCGVRLNCIKFSAEEKFYTVSNTTNGLSCLGVKRLVHG